MSDFEFGSDESFELALFRAAETQIEAGHHFLAVVTAQAAVVSALVRSVHVPLPSRG